MKTYEKYLNEGRPKKDKMARAFLKHADKRLNQVDDMMRDLKKQSQILEKQLQLTHSGAMFSSVDNMIGQVIGLTTSIYDEYMMIIEDYEDYMSSEK